MRHHDLPGEVQPHARALGAGGEEGQEDVAAQILRHAGAAVLHLDPDTAGDVRTAPAAPNARAVPRCAASAALRSRLISTCASRSGSASSDDVRLHLQRERHIDPFGREQLGQFGDEGPGLERAAAQGRRVGDRAVAVDEAAQPLGAARQRRHRNARVRHVGRLGIEQHLRRPGERSHRGERVQYLMRQHADQIGLRRHLDRIERALDRLDRHRADAQAEPFERGRHARSHAAARRACAGSAVPAASRHRSPAARRRSRHKRQSPAAGRPGAG